MHSEYHGIWQNKEKIVIFKTILKSLQVRKNKGIIILIVNRLNDCYWCNKN